MMLVPDKINCLDGGMRTRGRSKNSLPGKPLISVITVVFNGAETIRDTIVSVLTQSYDNVEYIVIDGGSNDGTIEILRQYEHVIDYWLSEKDRGIYDAMNKGIALSTGMYIGLLNSDDFLAGPRVLQDIVLAFEKNQTDTVFSCLNIVNRSMDKVLRRYRIAFFRPYLMRVGIVPPHPTLYCKQEVYKKVGKYKIDYRVSADFEMMVRMFVIEKISWFFLDETTVNMRAGGVSNNGLAGQVHQNLEIVRACKENGIYTNLFLIALKLPIKFFQTITAQMQSKDK